MTSFPILYLTAVRYLHDYLLEVVFSDGTTCEVDLFQELHGPVFEPLLDPALFAQAMLDPETRTVAWPSGADFAPEFLYEIGQVVAPDT